MRDDISFEPFALRGDFLLDQRPVFLFRHLSFSDLPLTAVERNIVDISENFFEWIR